MWEGYNVYQGASIAGPWTRIATYDRVNGVTTVLDVECDPESPVPLRKVKAFGTDAGVRYSIERDGRQGARRAVAHRDRSTTTP